MVLSLMRAVLLGFVVLGLSTPALAQGARVEGKVLDQDGKPIADATVTLENSAMGPARTLATNEKGAWAVLGLEAGAWNIDFVAEGYVTRKISVTLSSFSNPKPIEIRLERSGPPPELLEAAEKGDAAYAAGRFSEARGHYEKLLALRPDLGASLHVQIARCYKEEGNVEKEIEHLQAALDADPVNHTVRTLLAMEVIEMGEADRGLELLGAVDESEIASPDELLGAVDESEIASPDVFYNIGVSLLNKGKSNEAIEYFTRSVEVDPSYTDGYYQRGLTYLGLQKLEEAKEDFQRVLELVPEGAQAETARKVLQQQASQ
jgi:tetratricopeptide (TPR) repeat protein